MKNISFGRFQVHAFIILTISQDFPSFNDVKATCFAIM